MAKKRPKTPEKTRSAERTLRQRVLDRARAEYGIRVNLFERDRWHTDDEIRELRDRATNLNRQIEALGHHTETREAILFDRLYHAAAAFVGDSCSKAALRHVVAYVQGHRERKEKKKRLEEEIRDLRIEAQQTRFMLGGFESGRFVEYLRDNTLERLMDAMDRHVD